MKRLVITGIKIGEAEHLLFAEFNEERKIQDLQIVDEENTLVDQIYIGRVEKIADNIGAAFVRCTPELHAFLPLKDAASPIYTSKLSKRPELSQGDELLVQVTKDPIKTKLAILSAALSIKGICSVMETGRTGLGVSRKLPADAAARIRQTAQNIIPEDFPAEIILRTNAAEVSESILQEDLRKQKELYDSKIATASGKTVYSRIYTPDPSYIQKLKGMAFSEIEEIVTDNETIYRDLLAFSGSTIPTQNIRLYKDERYPLSNLYSLNALMNRLTSRQVWLSSGANIIIEQLETLTFIDVNSSKNQSDKQDAILTINKEAAAEIARQLRLRNISGMILIDFINMKENAQEELVRYLKVCLSEDPIRTQFMDITKLGLVELTRKKVHKSLKEIL